MDKLLLSVTEVADLLGRSRSRIYQLLETGELERVRDGASTLITAESVHQWVEQRRKASGEVQ